MVARARKVQRKWWSFARYTAEELDRAAKKIADNIQCCSCVGCGNPRRHHGGFQGSVLTRQERLAELYLREGILEATLSTSEDDGEPRA